MSELFAGTLTPEIARLKMLIEYTGYKPSWIQLIREALKKDREQREIINFNLLRLSEELNFAFTVEDNRIISNYVFKKNPIAFIRIGHERFYGRYQPFKSWWCCKKNANSSDIPKIDIKER